MRAAAKWGGWVRARAAGDGLARVCGFLAGLQAATGAVSSGRGCESGRELLARFQLDSCDSLATLPGSSCGAPSLQC